MDRVAPGLTISTSSMLRSASVTFRIPLCTKLPNSRLIDGELYPTVIDHERVMQGGRNLLHQVHRDSTGALAHVLRPEDLARPVPNLRIYPGEVRWSCKESGWLKGFRVSRRALRRKAVAKPVPMTHVREPHPILSTGSTSTRPTRNKAGKDARNAREHRQHDLGRVGVAWGRPDRDVK
jgi:hypothetical protein